MFGAVSQVKSPHKLATSIIGIVAKTSRKSEGFRLHYQTGHRMLSEILDGGNNCTHYQKNALLLTRFTNACCHINLAAVTDATASRDKPREVAHIKLMEDQVRTCTLSIRCPFENM